MAAVADEVDALAATTHFSGVVRADVAGEATFAEAYGRANRSYDVDNTVDTRFAIASGVKGLTALTVVSLIAEGKLALDTTARSVLGGDLAMIDDAVTIEHLLAHRSGIGDYLDEEAGYDVDDYVMPVPVHELVTTDDYVRILDGHQQKFPPGERFAYCNSGFVVLALIAERVGGRSFHDLVHERVCEPAGMHDTAFLRSDELPPRAATGYLASDGLRTNLFHLPVKGNGDGGISTTAADVHAFWAALMAGRIVAQEWLARMIEPRSDVPAQSMRYGLGFWLSAAGDAVALEGCDAGVSFRSVHDPSRRVTHTVLSNTTRGAWPIAKRLGELLGT